MVIPVEEKEKACPLQLVIMQIINVMFRKLVYTPYVPL